MNSESAGPPISVENRGGGGGGGCANSGPCAYSGEYGNIFISLSFRSFSNFTLLSIFKFYRQWYTRANPLMLTAGKSRLTT